MAGADLTVAADTRCGCGALFPEMRRLLAARGGAPVAQPAAKRHSSPAEDARSSHAGQDTAPVTASPGPPRMGGPGPADVRETPPRQSALERGQSKYPIH